MPARDPDLTRAWLIRAGDQGSMLDASINAGVIAMRYRTVGDARLHDVHELARQFALGKTRKDVLGGARRLKKFAEKVAEGDLVVSPRSSDRTVHIARVIGPYDFVDPSLVPDFRHLRPVHWLDSFNRVDLPTTRRKEIDRPPALYELPAAEWWEQAISTGGD